MWSKGGTIIIPKMGMDKKLSVNYPSPCSSIYACRCIKKINNVEQVEGELPRLMTMLKTVEDILLGRNFRFVLSCVSALFCLSG
jgi:hypothetical protein